MKKVAQAMPVTACRVMKTARAGRAAQAATVPRLVDIVAAVEGLQAKLAEKFVFGETLAVPLSEF
jgi:hypothetical protein